MSFTTNDYEQLQKILRTNPKGEELLQKLLDEHRYTISKISHEIRNPLTLIYSTLQLIEAQHPEVHAFQHWSELQEDIAFLTLLLQELSSYNNGEHIRRERFSSYEFLARTSLSFAASCEGSAISYSSEIPETLPVIEGDVVKLREVLLNLLKNAKDAVSPHGEIKLTASVKGDSLSISVIDDGCGIPPEHLETLFDAFVTHKPDGTGLGLAIAKKIVLAHKGNIFVTSDPSKGTCFTILLPVT